jgi:predicted dehydrogenase
MVGYNFRFYIPFQKIYETLTANMIGRVLSIQSHAGQYLPDWRPERDYRKSVSAIKELGGGVMLELSHELDYMRWFCGDVNLVTALSGHLSDLEIDVDDTAEIILQFNNGAIGHVHLDMIDRSAFRSCRIIGTRGTITWDGSTNQVRMYTVEENKWSDLHPAMEIDRNDMYLAEIKHFLRCVEENKQPFVTGEDGKRILEIALAAKRSSQEHKFVNL